VTAVSVTWAATVTQAVLVGVKGGLSRDGGRGSPPGRAVPPSRRVPGPVIAGRIGPAAAAAPIVISDHWHAVSLPVRGCGNLDLGAMTAVAPVIISDPWHWPCDAVEPRRRGATFSGPPRANAMDH
jgi:hypothetical protein